MTERTIKIETRIEPHECGMCGPSGMFVGSLRISDQLGEHKEIFRQAICDTSDPIELSNILQSALEYLGYTVTIKEREL